MNEGHPPGPVVDIRPRELYLESHLRGSANIPWNDLFPGDERAYELPEPSADEELTVVYSKDLHSVEELLEGTFRLYRRVRFMEEEEMRNGGKPVEAGRDSRYLWHPNPALGRKDVLERVESQLQEQGLPMRAMDLAAGNGRDAVFLASRGFSVWACDYQKRQCDKIERLAFHFKRDMCEELTRRFGTVNCSTMDLEKPPPRVVLDSLLQWAQGPVSLLLLARYLHRPLFATFHELISVGGFLCIHTFFEGAQLVGKKTPSNPKFLLQPGELRQMYEPHFDVLLDEVILLSDGRPTSCFLARRRV